MGCHRFIMVVFFSFYRDMVVAESGRLVDYHSLGSYAVGVIRGGISANQEKNLDYKGIFKGQYTADIGGSYRVIYSEQGWLVIHCVPIFGTV